MSTPDIAIFVRHTPGCTGSRLTLVAEGRRAGGTVTIEERIEKLNTITNAGTAVVGFLDLILHPESEEQKIDKDECLRKAFQNAERVLKAGHELRWDVITEKSRRG